MSPTHEEYQGELNRLVAACVAVREMMSQGSWRGFRITEMDAAERFHFLKTVSVLDTYVYLTSVYQHRSLRDTMDADAAEKLQRRWRQEGNRVNTMLVPFEVDVDAWRHRPLLTRANSGNKYAHVASLLLMQLADGINRYANTWMAEFYYAAYVYTRTTFRRLGQFSRLVNPLGTLDLNMSAVWEHIQTNFCAGKTTVDMPVYDAAYDYGNSWPSIVIYNGVPHLVTGKPDHHNLMPVAGATKAYLPVETPFDRLDPYLLSRVAVDLADMDPAIVAGLEVGTLVIYSWKIIPDKDVHRPVVGWISEQTVTGPRFKSLVKYIKHA